MSPVLSKFIEILDPIAKGMIRGTAKIVIENEGTVVLSETGAIVSNDETDVTLIAAEETFEAIMSGDLNGAMAFMSGKLKVEGSKMRALKVSEILTR